MKIISLGFGVQSTTLYFMSSTGFLPRADYAIFADPGAESKDTYNYIKYVLSWQKKNNAIPIIWCGKKSIYRDLISGTNSTGQRFASIPAFTLNDDNSQGMLRRQCTDEYKIIEVHKAIRNIYGLKPRKRMPETEIWIGITTDEIQRMKFPYSKWEIRSYPFCGYTTTKDQHTKIKDGIKFNRRDCIKWLGDNKFKIPPKSACIFCPFQSDARWLDMKRNSPKEWARSVKLDKTIRNSSKKGVKNPIFLHLMDSHH